MPQIDLGLIDPNPDQPRKLFDVAKLEELAAKLGIKQAWRISDWLRLLN